MSPGWGRHGFDLVGYVIVVLHAGLLRAGCRKSVVAIDFLFVFLVTWWLLTMDGQNLYSTMFFLLCCDLSVCMKGVEFGAA